MKPETMHPIEQWESLFTEVILSRGADYCRKQVVEDLRQDGTKIEADVAGSEVYHVHNASYSRARCGLAPISCCLCRAHKAIARAAGK